MSGFSRMASNFCAPEDEEEEELLEAVRNEGEEEVRFELEENVNEVRREVEDDEVRHEWEERVRLGVGNDEVRHEREARVRHQVDDGEVWHKEHEQVDGHELVDERVRHGEEVEEWDVIGITEEVLAFATNISRHPETWLDFPLLPDDESDGPFSCNSFTPSLQIVEARAMLMQRLQHRSKLETEQLCHHKDDFGMHSEEDTSKDITEAFPSMQQQAASVIPITDFETELHPIQVTEVAVLDKSVIKEQLPKDDTKTSNGMQEAFDDDIDDWFDEEADLAGHTTIPIGEEEDVIFSGR